MTCENGLKTLIIYMIDGYDLKYRIENGDYRKWNGFYVVGMYNVYDTNDTIVGNVCDTFGSKDVKLKDLFDESKYSDSMELIESKQFDNAILIRFHHD